MSKLTNTVFHRMRRQLRVRKKVRGTTARPRLSVFRSNAHIYAQIVDDDKGITLVAASTREKVISQDKASDELDKKGLAKKVGLLLAEKAKSAGVNTVVFDRNGFRYHGRVSALADGAREGGLVL